MVSNLSDGLSVLGQALLAQGIFAAIQLALARWWRRKHGRLVSRTRGWVLTLERFKAAADRLILAKRRALRFTFWLYVLGCVTVSLAFALLLSGLVLSFLGWSAPISSWIHFALFTIGTELAGFGLLWWYSRRLVANPWMVDALGFDWTSPTTKMESTK